MKGSTDIRGNLSDEQLKYCSVALSQRENGRYIGVSCHEAFFFFDIAKRAACAVRYVGSVIMDSAAASHHKSSRQ